MQGCAPGLRLGPCCQPKLRDTRRSRHTPIGVHAPTFEAARAPANALLRPERSRRALSLWITTARAFAALVGIAVPLVLVRVFDQTAFGYYKELFLIAGTAVPLLSFGLPASVFYLGPRHPHPDQDYSGRLFLLRHSPFLSRFTV